MATGAKLTSWRDQHNGLAFTYARVFDYDFALLEAHRRTMDDSLKAAIRDHDHHWIKIRDQVRDEEQMMAHAEAYHEAAELLPRLQWNAQLVLAYSTFEHSLNQLCKMAHARFPGSASLEDFQKQAKKRDQGIYKAKAYMRDIVGITTPFSTPSWRFADRVNKLRNVIAHTNGEFDDPLIPKQKLALDAFKDDPNVRVVINTSDGKHQRFRLTPQFLHVAIHHFAQVVQDVCLAEPTAQNLVLT